MCGTKAGFTQRSGFVDVGTTGAPERMPDLGECLSANPWRSVGTVQAAAALLAQQAGELCGPPAQDLAPTSTAQLERARDMNELQVAP